MSYLIYKSLPRQYYTNGGALDGLIGPIIRKFVSVLESYKRY